MDGTRHRTGSGAGVWSGTRSRGFASPWLSGAVLIAGAALVVLGGWRLHRAEVEMASALATAAQAEANAGDKVVEVGRMLEAMDLVSVVLGVTVRSEAIDSSWRGEVSAQVSVPARLYYGVDLKTARVERRTLGPGVEQFVVTVDRPKRLAGELVTGLEKTDLTLGWLRFRSRAGEYYLGAARKGLSGALDALVLSGADMASVEEQSRERIVSLVRMVAGRGALVEVEWR